MLDVSAFELVRRVGGAGRTAAAVGAATQAKQSSVFTPAPPSPLSPPRAPEASGVNVTTPPQKSGSLERDVKACPWPKMPLSFFVEGGAVHNFVLGRVGVRSSPAERESNPCTVGSRRPSPRTLRLRCGGQ